MAILNVAYDRKKKTAILYPLGSATPVGAEPIGVTGAGVTFYDAVRSLLRSIGVHQMGPVSIVFADDIQPAKLAEPTAAVEEEKQKEPVVDPKQRKISIF